MPDDFGLLGTDDERKPSGSFHHSPIPGSKTELPEQRVIEMTQMLAMSYDVASSPSITLKTVDAVRAHEQPYGWGFAWYPAEDNAALVIKDPTSIGENAMTKVLRDWDRFQSSVFVCHLRGAAQRTTQEDTHPFARSHAGRTFIMAHNGDLHGELNEALPLGDAPVFEPVGHTDSEWAFCWLMCQLRTAGARRLADVGWERLHGWFRRVNELGTANVILTDGKDVVIHADRSGFNRLHTIRRKPPHATTRAESTDIIVDFGGALDQNRTVFLASTRPLSDEPWEPMKDGQLLVVRRGQVQWDSHANGAPSFPAAISDAGDVGGPGRASARLRAPATMIGTSPKKSPTGPALNAQQQTQTQGVAEAPVGLPATAQPSGVTYSRATRQLSVFHETIYRNQQPVELSEHTFRLQPSHDLRQALNEYELKISINGLRRDYEDVFGNRTVRITFEEPWSEMSIVAKSLVTVPGEVNTDHLKSPLRRATIPLVWMPWQRQMMLPYLLPPELPESQLRALTDYAMSFVERHDFDLVETLVDMNQTIYNDFQYVSGSTTLETTPWEVFITRKGVCQDFANLFICMARLLNIPARYRVGYIFTGGDYENKIQSDASHAWVELYLPWAGWRGFDPTNGCLTGPDHVRVACGRNYRDATPTSGTIYRGGFGETLRVNVRLEEVPAGD